MELVNSSDLIQNFDKDCLTGAGYDLRIDRVYEIISGGFIGGHSLMSPKIDELVADTHTLLPGGYVLVETIEYVNIPNKLAGRILPRSSVFRCGVALMSAFVDPGYVGKLTLGLKNLSNVEFGFERGTRIAQLIFEEIDEGTTPYKGRYQGGQVIATGDINIHTTKGVKT